MTYVTPIALIAMLFIWGRDVAFEVLQFHENPNGAPYTEGGQTGAYVARALMLLLFAFFVVLVGVAARRGRFKNVENLPAEETA